MHARAREKSTCVEAEAGARTGFPNTSLAKHHLLTEGGRKRVASHKFREGTIEYVCIVNKILLDANEDIQDS